MDSKSNNTNNNQYQFSLDLPISNDNVSDSDKYNLSEIIDILNQYDYEKYVLKAPTFTDTDYYNKTLLLNRLKSVKDNSRSKMSASVTQNKVNPRLYSPTLRDAYFFSKTKQKKIFKSYFDKYVLPLTTVSFEDVVEFISTDNLNVHYSIESRCDGYGVVLKYDNYVLTSALTLSSGKKGLNIKEQIQSIYSVPLKINDPSNLEIYGFVTMQKADLEGICSFDKLTVSKSVENIILNSKEKEAFLKLVFVPFKIKYDDNTLQSGPARAFFDTNHFVKEPLYRSFTNKTEVINLIKEFQELSKTLDYIVYGASVHLESIEGKQDHSKNIIFNFIPKFELDRMNNLIALVSKYDNEYYVKDTPSVSDAEYDRLYDQLKQLEEKYHYITQYSPTLRIGGILMSSVNKHQHIKKLYSLNKAQSFDELETFINKVSLIQDKEIEFCIEHKFDGLTLSLTYKNGCLIKGATRGNGEVGEDVTDQVRTIRTVPLQIDYKGLIEIQGEAIIKLSVFNSLLAKIEKSNSHKLIENGESQADSEVSTLFKSPRNAAAGAIKNFDTSETAQRKLTFIAYNVGFCDNLFSTQIEMRKFLQHNGFNTEGPFEIVNSFAAAKAVINDLEEERDALDYEIDGVVLKVNNLQLRDELGYAEKYPEWAIAYKYKPPEKTTILKNVNWQISRAGRLTPVAILEPVKLGGVTVERAYLHNIADINQKDICYNDTVLIHRSNDVIPEIVKVVAHNSDSKKIIPPAICPECGAKTVLENAFIYCTNQRKCRGVVIQSLMHFTSKPCMNIPNLQEQYLRLFYDQLGINTFDGIFSLTTSEITSVKFDTSSNNVSEETAKNIIDAISSAKTVNLSNFLFALNIPQVGEVAARALATKYHSLANIISATESDIASLPDFGPVVSRNIINYFADSQNIEIINRMIELGVVIKTNQQLIENASSAISGKTIVVTGTISKYTRDELFSKIISLGGITNNSITKNTSFLVVGDNPGASKLKAANKYNIPILSEDEFLKMLDS
ncbi:MAG: NAD-dependent DNA ligase LigA [Christensenellaceae bacterium]|jgi:DNA ligase (NAD+)|nr:NAD-dependent DNA ligase LigA [Christensenellaceae bacterium]